MILNLRPMDMALLDCVIEECGIRFSAEEQEGILTVVGEVLGGVGRGGVDGEGGNGEEKNGEDEG